MKRASNAAQKLQRRNEIIQKSAELLSTKAFENLTLQEIALSLGLVKGTLFRYFSTKEALAIAVLLHELETWTHKLGPLFNRTHKKGPDGLAHFISTCFIESFRPHRLMLHLFSILNTQLEPKLDAESLKNFKMTLLGFVSVGAESLAENIPILKEKAQEIFFSLHAITIGCIHMGIRTDKVNSILEDENLSPFRLDFEQFLESNLSHIIFSIIYKSQRL